jgi:hypothetical protein
MRRRILSAALAGLAFVAVIVGVAGPAHASGTACSGWTTIASGVYGNVCVNAASSGATTAWSSLYNGTSYTIAAEAFVYVNGTNLMTECGTGIGQGVPPGGYLNCSTAATIWTASPRYGNATFYANNASGTVYTPWLY